MFTRIFFAIYDFLNVGQAPIKADCIFVYAGRQYRKNYGLNLFNDGYANRIIFSVGRFEWRAFPQLGLADDGGLTNLVQRTPPPKRHFFVCVDNEQAQCFLISKRKFGTLSEIIALVKYIQTEDIKSLIVVSTAFHLRRATETLKRYSRPAKLRIIPVAVPDELASDIRTRWWTNRKGICLVLSEYVKYIAYKLLLSPLLLRNYVRNLRQG